MATPAEQALIDAWIAKNGVTKCPTRHAVTASCFEGAIHPASEDHVSFDGRIFPEQRRPLPRKDEESLNAIAESNPTYLAKVFATSWRRKHSK